MDITTLILTLFCPKNMYHMLAFELALKWYKLPDLEIKIKQKRIWQKNVKRENPSGLSSAGSGPTAGPAHL